ncbi:MAG: glycosyltransferase [Salinivirgaceae bacterium]|nr:glycosyltransferase [Salinivirgaceae bacterium]
MAKKILIAVTNDLETDQRVFRIAKSLSENGFEIMLIGRLLKNSKALDLFCDVKRFKLCFNKQAFFYANYNIRLFVFLLFNKFDIVLSNDLDTLPACFLASKIKGKKIVYDSHEYFTEVPELIDQKFQRSFWLLIERIFVPKLNSAYTVSNSIAKEYNQKYKLAFDTVRNLPYRKNRAFEIEKNKVRTIIYQGALNVGRGIELMIESMLYLENVELLIVGTGDIDDELNLLISKLNVSEKVKMLGRINPQDLFFITQKAHLGLSLEEDRGLNYRFALPNKIFDYIQARIPVIVSDLPEMRNVIETYNIGEIMYERTPKALAQQIIKMLDKCLSDNTIHNNLEKAAQQLCWENEQNIMLRHFIN